MAYLNTETRIAFTSNTDSESVKINQQLESHSVQKLRRRTDRHRHLAGRLLYLDHHSIQRSVEKKKVANVNWVPGEFMEPCIQTSRGSNAAFHEHPRYGWLPRKIYHRSVIIPGIFLGGLTIPPKNGCQIVCCNCFFGRDSELQIYHGDFLLMDNKHRKLFVIKQSK